jgi:drug/metabolite transporter (DMT)-like permease
VLKPLAPVLFVLFWSTGFIVARAVTTHADVQFFLLWRFAATAILWGTAAKLANGDWPSFRRASQHVAAGAVMMGLYLCLSFWAIAQGLPAGIMALMGALQPLFTAALVLAHGRESLPGSTWWGLLIGFLGVILVLLPRIEGSNFALAKFAVLATSVLAQGLLMWMMRRGGASHVTALMLLVPPVAALLAYAIFHETLTLSQVAGFALALSGVVLARRAAR